MKQKELAGPEPADQQSLAAGFAKATNASDQKKLKQLQTIVFLAKHGISMNTCDTSPPANGNFAAPCKQLFANTVRSGAMSIQ